MTVSQGKAANKHELVKMWWDDCQAHLKPFFDVMAAGGRIHKDEVNAALNYLETRIIELAQAAHPEIVAPMREQLLASVENFIHCLHYHKEGNTYQSQVRYDMAKMNLDALRFHLISHGIMF